MQRIALLISSRIAPLIAAYVAEGGWAGVLRNYLTDRGL